MRTSHFLSKHQDHDLAFPNEIILIEFQIRELLKNADVLDSIIEDLKVLYRLNIIVDILCPSKKVLS